MNAVSLNVFAKWCAANLRKLYTLFSEIRGLCLPEEFSRKSNFTFFFVGYKYK